MSTTKKRKADEDNGQLSSKPQSKSKFWFSWIESYTRNIFYGNSDPLYLFFI